MAGLGGGESDADRRDDPAVRVVYVPGRLLNFVVKA